MSQFPVYGKLSMSIIATGLRVATNVPYLMINFVSTTLYNPNGMLYTVSDLPFSLPSEI